MKTLLLVTYVDFWRKGSGHRTRISSLVNCLKEYTRVTVFYAGEKDERDKAWFSKEVTDIDFEFASTQATLTYKEYKEKFREFIKDRFFDIALVEYIELSGLLEFLPDNTITILDTHDIVFKRVKSFKRLKVIYDGIVLSKQEELNIYRCFDYIILIQKTDLECIAKEIDASRLLLVPHPAILKRKMIRKTVQNVGFIASQYSPNIDALKWFIEEVWDTIYQKHNLVLNVYGNIKYSFSSMGGFENRNIVFHGFADDLEKVYDTLDIMVNPVRCGAGLKIKNVEALGYGLPLITSTHGASGIEDGASKAFLIANSAAEFWLAFDAMIGNYVFRKQIAENAFEYAQSNLSSGKCYANLLKILN
jgi:glycosyltransferase involved in cell wall biosynthesis